MGGAISEQSGKISIPLERIDDPLTLRTNSKAPSFRGHIETLVVYTWKHDQKSKSWDLQIGAFSGAATKIPRLQDEVAHSSPQRKKKEEL